MLLALALSSALAKPEPLRVDMEIWMPTTAEPGPFGWSDKAQQWFFSMSVDRRRRAPAVEGTVVEDGKLSIACNLDGDNVEVSLRFVPANYPEHLPEELQCPVGGVDVHVRILPRRPLYTDPAQLQVDLATGVDVRRYALEHGDVYSSSFTTFSLPTTTAWVSQEVSAIREGDRWTEAKCIVQAGERPTLLVATSEATPDGGGACDLVDAGGVSHRVPVHLVSLPPTP